MNVTADALRRTRSPSRLAAETLLYGGALLAIPAWLLNINLAELRVPIDALLVLVLAYLTRNRLVRAAASLFYLAAVPLFILISFNIDIASYMFYRDFSASIPPLRLVNLWVGMLFLLLMALLVFRPAVTAPRWSLVVLGIYCVLLGARLVTVGDFNGRRILALPSLTILRNVSDQLAAVTVLWQSQAAEAPAAAAAPPMFNVDDPALAGHIYFIVVESWADDEKGLKALESEAKSLFGQQLEWVSHGSRPTKGATLQGELRELCGLEVSVAMAQKFTSSRCLPFSLRQKGYATRSYHGYLSLFYLRSALYPKLGFDQSWFLDDLKSQLPQCAGAFRGLCDVPLFSHAVQAATGPREFLYFLSLQSHEPVHDIVAHTSAQPSANSKATGVARDFVSQSMKVVARSPRRVCVTDLYFVGDHPPPSLAVHDDEATPKVSFLKMRLRRNGTCAA